MTPAQRAAWDAAVAAALREGRYTRVNPVIPDRPPIAHRFGARSHHRPSRDGRDAVLREDA